MCGTPIAADARFCPSCGRQLRLLAPPPPAAPQPAFSAVPLIQEPEKGAQPHRPTGVSILTALVIIGGIIDLVSAAFFFVYAAVALSFLGILAGFGPTGVLLSLLSVGLLICTALSFVLSYGLWNARGWAWTWTLISSILGLIVSIIGITVGIGIIGIAVYAIMIYYLTRARVKAFFGRGPTLTDPMSPVGQVAPRPGENTP